MPARPRLRLADQASRIGPHTTPPADTSTGAGGLVAALTTSTAAAGADILIVPIEEVAPNPDNVRDDVGDVSELADSIRSEGILQPLVVVDAELWRHHHPGQTVNGNYVIIIGHRRRAASEKAGLTHVSVIVRNRYVTDAQRTVAMLIENMQRVDLSPLEQARGLAALAAAKLSQREIAKQTGLSQAQVSKRLSLLKLTSRGQQALADGRMSVDTALTLLRLPSDKQDAALDRAAQRGKPISDAVYDIQQQIQRDAKRQYIIDELTAAGVTVIDRFDPDADGRNGRYYDYALSYHSDREAAIAAGLAIAVVPSWCAHIDHVDYFMPTAKPWPWQHDNEAAAEVRDDDADPAANRDGAGDSTGITPAVPTPPSAEELATQSRQQVIADYLNQSELPATAAELLATLTVLGAAGDGEPDLDLVACLLSREPWHWKQASDVLTHVASGGTADQRLRHALALAFSTLEWDYPPADNDIADQAYQALIAELDNQPTNPPKTS